MKSRGGIIAATGVSIAACGNQRIEGYPVASWDGLLARLLLGVMEIIRRFVRKER